MRPRLWIYITCFFWFLPARAAEPSAAARPGNVLQVTAEGRNFQTHWQDESQYIVETIATDLAEMVYYGRHGTLLSAAAVEADEQVVASGIGYRVKIRLAEDGVVECWLPLTKPIWAPATYRPLVQALVAQCRLKVQPTESSGSSPDLLRSLLDPKAEALAKLDIAESSRLSKEFLSAARHEEAALLLGAFTLREASGIFYQIRSELCRITAHLALAERLRGVAAPTPAGRLAEVVLTALYNNQADALKLLEGIPVSDETDGWKRALRMRITSDFRSIGENQTPSLLEQVEWFRARVNSVNVKRAWDDLRLSEEQAALADWCRIANQRAQPVDVGHVLLDAALPAEIREYRLVFPLEQGREPGQTDMVGQLNTEPTRCIAAGPSGTVIVRIIGWGRWAAFLQRHLCHAICSNFHFLKNSWGVPDQAAALQRQADELFANLRLYPFVRRQIAPNESYYRKAQDEEMKLVHAIPHEIPAEAWNNICFNPHIAPLYIPPPHAFINEWHRHNPPPGTAYNVEPRFDHPSLMGGPEAVSRLEKLHRIAPYDPDVAFMLLRTRDAGKSTPAQVIEAYGPMLDFNPAPSRRIAELSATDPAAYEKWMNKAAVLDPSARNKLAWFYANAHRDADAANAFVQWMANESDEVFIAEDAGWLVDYFERTGQSAAATALADRAATVYSSPGLLTKAKLLESRHDYAGALEFQQKNTERYHNPAPLMGFLVRAEKVASNAERKALLAQLTAKYLPEGLEKFAINYAPAPKTGVRVEVMRDEIKNAGLEMGDIVAAVRGYRVFNWSSFRTIRGFEPDTPYEMIVWRNGHYLTLPALPATYKFGVNLVDYYGQ